VNELFAHAQAARRQTIELRQETSRLTRAISESRTDHVERRRSCHQALVHSFQVRESLPSWPAWSGPTPDLRSTLVPIE
jgi:hypothetical protein